MKKSRIEEKRMKIVICDDSKDDLEQTLPECLDDILREDDIIYIETSRHKNVFYTAGETYSIILYHGGRGMGSIYFFDTFLKKKNIRRLQRCRYVYFQK